MNLSVVYKAKKCMSPQLLKITYIFTGKHRAVFLFLYLSVTELFSSYVHLYSELHVCISFTDSRSKQQYVMRNLALDTIQNSEW